MLERLSGQEGEVIPMGWVRERVLGDGEPMSRERLGVAGVWALIGAPMMAHGLWRPIEQTLSSGGDAGWVTWAALAVAAVAWVAVGVRQDTTRWAAAGVVATVGGLLVGGLAAVIALTAVAIAASALLPLMVRTAPRALDGLAQGRRGTTAACALVALAAITFTARLSTFQGDAHRTEMSVTEGIAPDFTHHACVTAYFQAARLAEQGVENLYLGDWWPMLEHSATGATQAAAYAPFELDAYAYPPPFLLLPRLLGLAATDFSAQRALWFGFSGLAIALGLWLLVGWLNRTDPRAAARVLLVMPALWVCYPVLLALQIGNVHLVIMVMAVLGMVAFERDRPAVGGALLAFATLAKISPGFLGLMLLVQRRWRPVFWTVGFGVIWSLLALGVFGLDPFIAFVEYQLPRLASGEALSFLTRDPVTTMTNLAPFGVPFKLESLGWVFDKQWAVAAQIGQVFSVALVIVTVLGARRREGALIDAGRWMAVLSLGALRSPLAPPYVFFTFLWLLTLWAAGAHRQHTRAWLALAAAMTMFPLTATPQSLSTVVSLGQQVGLVAMLGWFLLRPRRAFDRTQGIGLSPAG